MTYRSDEDAQEEQARARIVRIRSELHALEAQIGVPPASRRPRWVWLGAGVAVGAALASLVLGAMLLVPGIFAEPALEGAPDAARQLPDRREIDTELLRLHAELQGCAPSSFDGRVQADVTFAGSTGAVHDVGLVNHGTATLEQGTLVCIRQTFSRLGTQRFRAPSYLYRITLEWRAGTLLPEPMGALDGL